MSDAKIPHSGSSRVAIVGAGIRGLTSAAYFKRQGHDIRIFDKAEAPGGVWRQVYSTSVINSPAHGYTFHPSNRWHSAHPNRDQVLANIDRLIIDENLSQDLRLGVAVSSVQRSTTGQWLIPGEEEPFDGVLVCSGFLGQRKEPPPGQTEAFTGRVLLPYAFDPQLLREQRVVVVGSGATALEMLELCHRMSCRNATLVVRPDTDVRETNRVADAKFWVSSNPFLYALTKSGVARPAAVAPNISPLLAASNTRVMAADFLSARGDVLSLLDGRRLEADVLLWCTGWHSPTPDWASQSSLYPNLLVAACPRCLDTAGFGFGASTVYAKVLDCILRFGLEQPFDPGRYGCDCEADPCRHGPNIIVTAMRYLAQQPDGMSMIWRLARAGLRSNWRRLRETDEPAWVSLLSFINAPLGL